MRVNVNVGTSGVRCDEDLEVEKAKTALREGADTLMDLSTAGDLARIRRRILELMRRLEPSRSTRLSDGRGALRTSMPTSSLTSSGSTANRASIS